MKTKAQVRNDEPLAKGDKIVVDRRKKRLKNLRDDQWVTYGRHGFIIPHGGADWITPVEAKKLVSLICRSCGLEIVSWEDQSHLSTFTLS